MTKLLLWLLQPWFQKIPDEKGPELNRPCSDSSLLNVHRRHFCSGQIGTHTELWVHFYVKKRKIAQNTTGIIIALSYFFAGGTLHLWP